MLRLFSTEASGAACGVRARRWPGAKQRMRGVARAVACLCRVSTRPRLQEALPSASASAGAPALLGSSAPGVSFLLATGPFSRFWPLLGALSFLLSAAAERRGGARLRAGAKPRLAESQRCAKRAKERPRGRRRATPTARAFEFLSHSALSYRRMVSICSAGHSLTFKVTAPPWMFWARSLREASASECETLLVCLLPKRHRRRPPVVRTSECSLQMVWRWSSLVSSSR